MVHLRICQNYYYSSDLLCGQSSHFSTVNNLALVNYTCTFSPFVYCREIESKIEDLRRSQSGSGHVSPYPTSSTPTKQLT